MCFVVLLSWELYRCKEKCSPLHEHYFGRNLSRFSYLLKGKKLGLGRKEARWRLVGKRGERERVSLLLPVLVLTCAYLGYAPAEDLLSGKNSGDTRWCARSRARTTKPEVEKSFRAEMPGYCQGRDLLSGNTVMFRYWEGPNCEWSVQMQ